MKNGREYFRQTPIVGGMLLTPITADQLYEKYRDCAS